MDEIQADTVTEDWPDGLPPFKTGAELHAEFERMDDAQLLALAIADLRDAVAEGRAYLAKEHEYYVRRQFDIEYRRWAHDQIRGGIAARIWDAVEILEHDYRKMQKTDSDN